jgi:general secretion pathway protein C
MERDRKKKMKRLPLLINVMLFAAICALISFWAMKVFNPKPRNLTAPTMVTPFEPAVGQWGPVFGQDNAVQNAPSIFALKGVVYSERASEGIALIVVDGKPGLAVPIGKEFAPNIKLLEVHATYIMISEAGVSRRVDVPPVTPGSLTPNFVPSAQMTAQPLPQPIQQQPVQPSQQAIQ